MSTKRKMTGPVTAGLVLSAVAQAVLAQAAAPEKAETGVQSLETVIITANKREERLQDVPASAAVVQQAQIEQQKVSAVADLSRAVPTLAGVGNGMSIRGFGSQSFTATSEGSVGVLVDGVPLAGQTAIPPNLFDVERVEVLEGPQGTLFGKNATAGIINIVTKAPSVKGFEGAVRGDVQTRNGWSSQAALNLPVSSTLALRVAATLKQEPGGMHNLRDDSYSGLRRQDIRVRALWAPTTDVKVNLIADSSQNDIHGGAPWVVVKSTPGSLLSTMLGSCGVTVGLENVDACVDPSTAERIKSRGLAAQIAWNLGDYTLTSVTAWRKGTDFTRAQDLDSMPNPGAFPSPFPFATPTLNQSPNNSTRKNISQEIRVASPDYDWGNFVAGVYFLDADVSTLTTQSTQGLAPILGMSPPLPANTIIGQSVSIAGKNKSQAIFGQGTYHVTEEFSLTLGGRLGREEVSADKTGALAAGALAPFSTSALTPVSGSTKDTYNSWRLGAQYEFTRRNMAYVTFTRGYKGPAINDNATNASTPLVVRPEIPEMVEIGSKNLFLNGKLGVNVAIYNTRVKDFQAQIWDPVALGFVFANAPTANTRGVSMSFYGRPTSALSINGGVAYMIAEYGAGYLVQCRQGSAAGCLRDAHGDPINGTPRWSANLSADYGFGLGGLKASVGGDLQFKSQRVYDPTDPMLNLGAKTIAGARFGVRSADDAWGISLYSRNLLDKFNPNQRLQNFTGFAGLDFNSYVQVVGPEARRTFGVSFDAKF